tara:strand:- start:2113 stop:2325 length:213 start_codon:yes stop_codon:yes gene_type:complete
LSPKYISTNKYEIKNEIIPSRFKKNDEYMANEITGVKFGRCGKTLEKNIIDKIHKKIKITFFILKFLFKS